MLSVSLNSWTIINEFYLWLLDSWLQDLHWLVLSSMDWFFWRLFIYVGCWINSSTHQFVCINSWNVCFFASNFAWIGFLHSILGWLALCIKHCMHWLFAPSIALIGSLHQCFHQLVLCIKPCMDTVFASWLAWIWSLHWWVYCIKSCMAWFFASLVAWIDS